MCFHLNLIVQQTKSVTEETKKVLEIQSNVKNIENKFVNDKRTIFC